MGEFNNDELTAPGWMSKVFFRDVLKKSENDDSVSVTDIKISPATKKGDHYASVMFRATISYTTSRSKGNLKSMIIKTMPELDGTKKELLKESFIFETENMMYSETIPKFEAELRKIGDKTELGGKALYHSLEPIKCIIFEDVVPEGYETVRDRMVTVEEAKAALLKLAKWHAVSYKLAAEGDSSVTDYKESFLSMKDVEKMSFMTTIVDNFVDKISTMDEFKKYIHKFRVIQKDILQKCIASFNSYRQQGAQGIFVLCHGDFHAKNMMFKRNDKVELEDVLLHDFQMCYFGPAVLDLIYSFYTLLSEDLRKYHRDELTYYYASNFIETLERLKFQGEYPKISDFYIDILRHRHWELFLFTGFLPMWYGMLRGTADPEQLMNSNDARRGMYDIPDYVNEVNRLLPIMLNQGYLD